MNKINKKKILAITYLVFIFIGIYITLIMNAILIIQFLKISDKVKNFETNFNFNDFHNKINNFENKFNFLINKINYYESNLNNITLSNINFINQLLDKVNSMDNKINKVDNNINNIIYILDKYNNTINYPSVPSV